MAVDPGSKDISRYASAISSVCNISLIAKVVDVVKNEANISPYAQLGRVIQICDEASKIPADVKPKLIDVFMQYDPRGCVRYVNRKTSMLEYVNKEQAIIITEQQKEIGRLKSSAAGGGGGEKKRKAEEEPERHMKLVGYDKVMASPVVPSNGSV